VTNMTLQSKSTSKANSQKSVDHAGEKSPSPTKNGQDPYQGVKVLNSRELYPNIKKEYGMEKDGTRKADKNLVEMWTANREFQKAIVGDLKNLSEQERIELTKETLLHITSEQIEMLKALGRWKTVLGEERPVSRSGILEEVIDISKFLINICIFWDLDPDMFLNDFFRKTEVNWQKFKQKTNPLRPDDKIAIFDLDGVLASYPEDWITFMVGQVNHMRIPSCESHLNEGFYYKIKDLHHIAQEIGISQEVYDSLKHEWRETGWDGKLHVMHMAEFVLKQLKERDYKIMILTRRPVEQYKRIYADTIMWLKTHNLPFDGIFWSDGEKEKELLSKFSNVRFVVEDDPVQATNLVKVGFKVFLLDKPYNRELEMQDGKLIVIHRLNEIFGWQDML